jgi:O-antigen/teichoic acid export membrane protein
MSVIRDRYLATLVSGYALIGLQIVVSLAMVPLALSYLGKETFGIWSLAAQVSIWLQLLDAGMNGALARHMIDYRSDPAGDGLKFCISTGFRVLCIQGGLILIAAILMGQFAGPAFGLQGEESLAFGRVLLILGSTTCLGFVSKILQSWLFATQRLDICNFIGLGVYLGEFFVFWLLLRTGHGLYSLAWARLCSTTVSSCLVWWTGIRFAKFPTHLLKGGWNAPMFRKLASYGGGMFLLTLGTQLLTMTQTALVTKFLGLGTAAVWATAPKLFQVVLQMVSKLWDYRVPHLSSLMAGNQTALLTRNFCGLFRATAYIGGGALGTVIALNPGFLSIWTHDAIHWAPMNNGLIALAFYLSLLIRCFTDFVMHTKKIGWMPALMLCEGIIFVGFAMWLLPRYGIPGMLVASLVAGGLLRFPYAWQKFRLYLTLDGKIIRSLVTQALGGALIGAALYSLLSLTQTILHGQSIWVSLISQGTLAALLMGPIALKLVLSSQKSSHA